MFRFALTAVLCLLSLPALAAGPSAQWLESGIAPEQVRSLQEVWVLGQSAAVCVTQECEDAVRRRSLRTMGVLRVRDPLSASMFLLSSSPERLVSEGLVSPGELGALRTTPDRAFWDALLLSMPEGKDRTAALSSLLESHWQFIAMPSGRAGDVFAGEESLASARESLSSAVRLAGLSGMWVPPGLWDDSAGLRRMAGSLVEMSTRVEKGSGLGAGALGLGGRVMFRPLVTDMSVTSRMGADSYLIAGNADDLDHEWAHALDATVRRAVWAWGGCPDPVAERRLDNAGMTLTFKLKAKLPSANPVSVAWGEVLSAVASPSEWTLRLDSSASLSGNPQVASDLRSPVERVAWAVAAVVAGHADGAPARPSGTEIVHLVAPVRRMLESVASTGWLRHPPSCGHSEPPAAPH